MGLVHDKMGHGVANVHRLDADTSGLLLCAKTKPALDFLSGQFQSKTVAKKYLAFAVVLPVERAMKVVAPIRDAAGGLPDTFTVEVALGATDWFTAIPARREGQMKYMTGRSRMTSAVWALMAISYNDSCSIKGRI